MIHSARQSPKFIKLVRQFRNIIPQDSIINADSVATAILEKLWHAAISGAKRGDIGRFENEVIAEMCGWLGDADELIEILVSCGWLDVCSTHRLIVHDWKDHAPRHIKGNVVRHFGSFLTADVPVKEAPKEAPKEDPCDHPNSTKEATPNLTQPNLTQPNLTKPNINPNGSNSLTDEKIPTKSKRKKVRYSDEFEAWWKTYHSRAGKTKAGRAFEKLTADERAFLRIATVNYGRVLEAQGGSTKILHGSTFINERFPEYDDETTEQLIAEATRQNTPYQAGDHLLNPLEEKLAREEAEAEAGIVEGHIIENETPLIGQNSLFSEPAAEDVAKCEQMQNSDFYQYLKDLKTNP